MSKTFKQDLNFVLRQHCQEEPLLVFRDVWEPPVSKGPGAGPELLDWQRTDPPALIFLSVMGFAWHVMNMAWEQLPIQELPCVRPAFQMPRGTFLGVRIPRFP